MPTAWVVALNVLGWPVIQLSCAWLGERIPVAWFNPQNWIFRTRAWEADGKIYDRLVDVRRWKDRLPDGARLFAGAFSKGTLRSREASYLEQYRQETCRGELVHWAAGLCAPVFWLWNPLWASSFMTIYALATNLPCILAQRYNRARLARVLGRQKRASDREEKS